MMKAVYINEGIGILIEEDIKKYEILENGKISNSASVKKALDMERFGFQFQFFTLQALCFGK